MIKSCPTCGKQFAARPRRKFCSLPCVARPSPRTPPRKGHLARELEQTAIRIGRAVAVESGQRFVELFTGSEAERSRRIVYKRILRMRPEIPPSDVSAAISAALVPGPGEPREREPLEGDGGRVVGLRLVANG